MFQMFCLYPPPLRQHSRAWCREVRISSCTLGNKSHDFNHVLTAQSCDFFKTSWKNCVTSVLLELTGLKGPMIRDAIPFPSKLLDGSSFLSPSFFTGGIPYYWKTNEKSRFLNSKNEKLAPFAPSDF